MDGPRKEGATISSSSIRTVTVGSGFRPDLLDPEWQAMLALAGSTHRQPCREGPTAGGDFHPAL